MNEKALIVILEILKPGVYNGYDITRENIQEILNNAQTFPIVNGHSNSNEREYESTNSKGNLLAIKDDVLIAEIVLDLESQLGQDYLLGKYFNWSAVISKVNDKYVISELGLLGNRAPAVKGLKEISRVAFSEDKKLENSLEIEIKNEEMIMEELKAMIEELVKRVTELEKKPEVPVVEAETPELELAEVDILKADKEKLMKEIEDLKSKVKGYEDAKFSEVIEAYSAKDETKKAKLIELSEKFAGDYAGFETIVKSITSIPEKEVLIVTPNEKRQVSNIQLSEVNKVKKISVKNM